MNQPSNTFNDRADTINANLTEALSILDSAFLQLGIPSVGRSGSSDAANEPGLARTLKYIEEASGDLIVAAKHLRERVGGNIPELGESVEACEGEGSVNGYLNGATSLNSAVKAVAKNLTTVKPVKISSPKVSNTKTTKR